MDRHPRINIWNQTRGGGLRWTLALVLIALAGCSQSGPFARRQGMVGALKTNVAQLDSEKAALARQLAEQKAENRRIETELADIEAQNGELAARLDDARVVMSRQGIDEGRSASARPAADRDGTRRATPARVQPKGRRTPFAQIPSERRALDNPDQSDTERDRDELLDPRRSRDDRDDQGRLDDRSPWMPVARGKGSATRSR